MTLNECQRYNCLKICYNEKKVLNSFRKNYLSPQINEQKKTTIKYMIICYITILRIILFAEK